MTTSVFQYFSTRNTSIQFVEHCRNNNLDGVNDCLSRGVNINTKGDCYGSQWSGLMVACSAGNPTIVSRLVKLPGLDINDQDETGDTAAHRACYHGRTECVRVLAETDRVDWNKADNSGETPLYSALAGGHSDIVDIIIQQPNLNYNVKTLTGETLGHAAAKGGDVKCLETLAAQETFDCWNVPDSEGITPLMRAVLYQRLCVSEVLCNILLKCPRVDVNLRNLKGENLYLMACKAGNTEIVALLEECPRIEKPMKKEKENNSNQEYLEENSSSTTEINDKMSRMQDVHELKTKIKEKEGEIVQLRATADKETEDLSNDLEMIEKEIEMFAETKKKAEEEIRRLQEVIENCNLNISNRKRDQEAKKDQAQRNNARLKAAEDNLRSEIKEMKNNLESNLKTVDDLMRKSLTWSVQSAWRLRGERSSSVVPSAGPGWW